MTKSRRADTVTHQFVGAMREEHGIHGVDLENDLVDVTSRHTRHIDAVVEWREHLTVGDPVQEYLRGAVKKLKVTERMLIL